MAAAAYSVNKEDLLEAHMLGLRDLVRRLEKQLSEVKAEAEHLKKENATLWQSVYERDDMIRELQDMNLRARGDQ